MAALVGASLMPASEAERKRLEALDPYALRAAALDRPARALLKSAARSFISNQRRGFKSNRKTDKKDKDKGKIALASEKLREALRERNCRTFGEFLWMRHRGQSHDPRRVRDPGRKPTRIRLEGAGRQGAVRILPDARHDPRGVRSNMARPGGASSGAADTRASRIHRARPLSPARPQAAENRQMHVRARRGAAAQGVAVGRSARGLRTSRPCPDFSTACARIEPLYADRARRARQRAAERRQDDLRQDAQGAQTRRVCANQFRAGRRNRDEGVLDRQAPLEGQSFRPALAHAVVGSKRTPSSPSCSTSRTRRRWSPA